MTWFEWSLIGFLGIESLLVIGYIGRPRKPITPGSAIITVVIYAAIIVGLVTTR